MSIKEFELFHGAILTKLIRSDRPISLSMFETKPDDTWASYTINDAVDIYVKHSTASRKISRGEGGFSWTFGFSPEHVAQIKEIQKKRPVYVALVCGHKSVKEGRMEICFLNPGKVLEVIDFDSANSQSITVRYNTGAKKLRVYQERKVEVMVSLNELDSWEIPGR